MSRLQVAALAAFGRLVSACRGANGQQGGDTTKLVVAGAPMIPRAGIDIAVAKGYFAEEDLEIEIVPQQSAPEQMPLLASGQVDVSMVGPAAVHFNALAAAIPVRIVAPCGSSSADGKQPNLALTVRKELHDSGEVTSVAALKDKRIALSNRETKSLVDIVELLRAEDMTGR